MQLETARENIHIRTGCHCNPGACRKYLRQPVTLYEEYVIIQIIIIIIIIIISLMREKDSCSDEYDQYHDIPLGAGNHFKSLCL